MFAKNPALQSHPHCHPGRSQNKSRTGEKQNGSKPQNKTRKEDADGGYHRGWPQVVPAFAPSIGDVPRFSAHHSMGWMGEVGGGRATVIGVYDALTATERACSFAVVCVCRPSMSFHPQRWDWGAFYFSPFAICRAFSTR